MAQAAMSQTPEKQVSREYKVKAAFLYNFGQHVTWPKSALADSQTPFSIGVIGQDPFGSLLDRIARIRRMKGRRIEARHFRSVKDYKPCHILFIPAALDAETQKSVIRATAGQPVLVVGEVPDFLKWGGTITFFLQRGTVAFAIDVDDARRRHLVISAPMLKIARVVTSR